MNVSEVFTAKRFGHLLRKDAFDSYRATLVGTAAAAAVMLLIYAVASYAQDVNVHVGNKFMTGGVDPFHIGMLSIILFVAGPIITSRVFKDMHDRVKNHDWLMFPASVFEKFIERWFVSGIVFSVASIFGYFILSSLYAGIAELVLSRSIPIFNPFSSELWLMVAHYLVAQTLFVLGAAYFRKNHYIKTILSVALIGIGLMIVSAILFRIVYWDLFRELFLEGGVSEFAHLQIGSDTFLGRLVGEKAESLGKFAATTAQVVYWGVFGPLCLTIAFFRVKETEVKDGV